VRSVTSSCSCKINSRFWPPIAYAPALLPPACPPVSRAGPLLTPEGTAAVQGHTSGVARSELRRRTCGFIAPPHGHGSARSLGAGPSGALLQRSWAPHSPRGDRSARATRSRCSGRRSGRCAAQGRAGSGWDSPRGIRPAGSLSCAWRRLLALRSHKLGRLTCWVGQEYVPELCGGNVFEGCCSGGLGAVPARLHRRCACRRLVADAGCVKHPGYFFENCDVECCSPNSLVVALANLSVHGAYSPERSVSC